MMKAMNVPGTVFSLERPVRSSRCFSDVDSPPWHLPIFNGMPPLLSENESPVRVGDTRSARLADPPKRPMKPIQRFRDGLYSKLATREMAIQTTTKLMLTFQPDKREAEGGVAIETGMFLGVREEPALESTQLRWQVQLHPGDIVHVESSDTYLENLGGALFLTTREPPLETQPDETRGPIGWMKWLEDNGRRSFQIQLAISGVGFDRVAHLAEQGQYPDAILTFKEDGPIEHGFSPENNKKVWTSTGSSVALIAEFTLRYDFAPFVRARAQWHS